MLNFILALLMSLNIQTGTLYETYDNVACFETNDGNLWECYVDAPETLAVGEYELIFINDCLVQFVQK